MTFAQLVQGIVGVINLIIIPIIFALAFLVFVWGVFQYYFIHSDDQTARKKGRDFALWGILGMVLLFSIWGVVNLLLSTLGIKPPA